MLVFDIDGTLTDTVHLDGECYVEAVRHVLGVALDGDWSRFEQVTDQGIANELLRGWPEVERATLGIRLRDDFLGRLSSRIRDQRGVSEIAGSATLLERLAVHGIDHALATGAWRDGALLKLRSAGLPIDRLASTSSETPVRRAIFERAARASGEVTLIGDGLWDAAVARELGWRFIGRADSAAKSRTLLGAGAEAVVEDFSDPGTIELLLGA